MGRYNLTHQRLKFHDKTKENEGIAESPKPQ